MKKAVAAICLTLGLVAHSLAACPPGAHAQAASKDLTVTNSSFRFIQDKDERSILTVGTLKNTSTVCIDNIQLEVRYFDAKGDMSDTVTRKLYQVEAPPQGEVGFRIHSDAARLKDAYVTQQVRIIATGTPSAPKKEKNQDERSLLVDLLVSWGPMLLLIGVWMFYMRKASPMNRLIIEQNRLFEAQVKLLERMTVMAENRARPEKDN